MSMGMEKLNEKGVDAGAEVNKAMDELKDVNADSLKAGLEEATKALDSMSKNNPSSQCKKVPLTGTFFLCLVITFNEDESMIQTT